MLSSRQIAKEAGISQTLVLRKLKKGLMWIEGQWIKVENPVKTDTVKVIPVIQNRFCCKCGSKFDLTDNFCGMCGETRKKGA